MMARNYLDRTHPTAWVIEDIVILRTLLANSLQSSLPVRFDAVNLPNCLVGHFGPSLNHAQRTVLICVGDFDNPTFCGISIAMNRNLVSLLTLRLIASVRIEGVQTL
jgi:hypothetical protein